MTKKEPVTPAFGAFLSKCQKEQLVNGRHLTNETIAQATMMSTRNLQPFKKGLSNNINQIHAVTHFWRSFPKTEQEKESFEKEVADCLERDLRNYRIHTGVLKP